MDQFKEDVKVFVRTLDMTGYIVLGMVAVLGLIVGGLFF